MQITVLTEIFSVSRTIFALVCTVIRPLRSSVITRLHFYNCVTIKRHVFRFKMIGNLFVLGTERHFAQYWNHKSSRLVCTNIGSLFIQRHDYYTGVHHINDYFNSHVPKVTHHVITWQRLKLFMSGSIQITCIISTENCALIIPLHSCQLLCRGKTLSLSFVVEIHIQRTGQIGQLHWRVVINMIFHFSTYFHKTLRPRKKNEIYLITKKHDVSMSNLTTPNSSLITHPRLPVVTMSPPDDDDMHRW